MAKFKPGQSGNPAGRKPGIPDKRVAWRKALEPHGQELISKALELAMEGDVQALKACLDRICPPYRPAAAPVEFTLEGETLTEQAQSVLVAIAAGELDPQTGVQIINSIASVAKIAELDEILERIEALEASNAK